MTSDFYNQTCTSLHALNNEVCVMMSSEFELMRRTWGQFLFEVLFGAGLYGINLLLSSATAIVLLRTGTGMGKSLASKQLLVTLGLMLIVATTYIVVSVVAMFKLQYTPAHIAHITIFASSLDIPLWAERTQNTLFLLQILLGDAVNIWRCYILYAKKIKVILFPISTALVGAGVGLSANLGSFGSATMVNSIWAGLAALSTLYCTATIARKIYTAMRAAQRTRGLFPVFLVLIETGAVFTLVLVVYLVATLASNASTYAQGALTAIIAQLPPLLLCALILQLKFFQDGEAVQYSVSAEETRTGPAAGGVRLWAAFRRVFAPAKDAAGEGTVSTFRAAVRGTDTRTATRISVVDVV
ncbi:hypothetical protein DENSPDRAFT_878661 [Dentipellis sp. KUC8613]|nr:hypothetical protein DENSPDRAFT_878661 [Dentipellis sp. KUC8613]